MKKVTNISLALLLSFISCVKDTDQPGDIDKIIVLTIEPNTGSDPNNLPADGISQLRISAILGKNSDDKKQVSFYTSNGQFISYTGGPASNNVNQIAINKVASVLLKSSTIPESGLYVTAKVDDYYVKKYINFTPSQPDTFFIMPDSYFTTSDKVNIDVNLLKNPGFVSSKIPIYFSASVIDSPDLAVSIEPYKYTDNSSGNTSVTVRSVLQKINSKTGTVRVKVECKNRSGTSIQKTVDIKFQ